MRDPVTAAGHQPRTLIDPSGSCLICSAPAPEIEGCCSLRCAEQAQRELRHNVARLRLLRRNDAAADTRRHLAERNGRLSSALLRYRPTESVPVA